MERQMGRELEIQGDGDTERDKQPGIELDRERKERNRESCKKVKQNI